jgi:hypothetical protein
MYSSIARSSIARWNLLDFVNCPSHKRHRGRILVLELLRDHRFQVFARIPGPPELICRGLSVEWDRWSINGFPVSTLSWGIGHHQEERHWTLSGCSRLERKNPASVLYTPSNPLSFFILFPVHKEELPNVREQRKGCDEREDLEEVLGV